MYKEPYSFNIARYMEPERFARFREFAGTQETPVLIVDLDIIKAKYLELQQSIPNLQIYYAVKANPMNEVIRLLDGLGSNFDVASVNELDQLLQLGIDPKKMSYGNTIKKARDIRYFHEHGVPMFVTDSELDLQRIAENAPGAKVYFRLLTEGTGADWPLSRKFGAHPDVIYNLILKAPELGLVPWGVSFHVGSQQRDIGQWDDAIARAKYIFDAVLEEGIELQMINLGGGYPASYVDPTYSIEEYSSEIKRFIEEDFGEHIPQLVMEPGAFAGCRFRSDGRRSGEYSHQSEEQPLQMGVSGCGQIRRPDRDHRRIDQVPHLLRTRRPGQRNHHGRPHLRQHGHHV